MSVSTTCVEESDGDFSSNSRIHVCWNLRFEEELWSRLALLKLCQETFSKKVVPVQSPSFVLDMSQNTMNERVKVSSYRFITFAYTWTRCDSRQPPRLHVLNRAEVLMYITSALLTFLT